MRILLLGNTGQLGWELERALAPLGQVDALDYPVVDLLDPASICAAVRQSEPQIIVNAAAYTAVDSAEQEPERAFAVNDRGPGVLAAEARSAGAALVHYSTDYVFDGTAAVPYTEADVPNPLGVYGGSKLAGERAVQEVGGAYLILRTAWVYSLRRDCFPTKVLEWARRQRVLRVVDDQVSNPTWARMLAEATALVLAQGANYPACWLSERSGVYHLAGDGHTSRYEWARAVLSLDPYRETQIAQELVPAKTADFPTPARRPLHSALNCDRFAEVFGLRLPEWRAALRLAMSPGAQA
jgi:dTDP-4-dehydrorhamnose reductase